MRYAVIENGYVTNAVEADPDFATEQGWAELPDGVGIGWSWDGATFTAPPPPPPVVPDVVTMAQARLALLGAGLLSTVDATIAAMPSPQREATQIEWEFRAEVHRNSQLVLGLGAGLGLTSGQIDALFIAAAAL